MVDVKHTPGPLSVHRTGHEEQFVVASDWLHAEGDWGNIYVHFSGYFGSYGPDMFAAAPDMLEALKEAKSELRDLGPDHPAMREIDAAIDKAEGRS
ncbi:hypothetical protein [Nitratireductor sp. GCM10026969]|uniref:hypothetical protein n=1 Tax=Nitratireductor sp. GCM10026969 TaxID=3252645 RepID=UPI00361C1FF2